MSAEEPAPGADIDHFRSVDSTPAAYALSRPASVANGFLVNFTAASLLLLTGAVVLFNADAAGRSRDIIVASGGGEQASVPVRLFVVAFFVVFARAVATNGWRRAWIGLQLLGVFAVVVVAIDVGASLADAAGLTTPVVGQQIVSGLIAMVTFPVIVIRNTHLPEPVDGPLTGTIRWHAWIRLSVPLILAFILAVAFERFGGDLAQKLRNVALMGGIGPGIFLVQQLFAFMTAGIGIVIVRRSRRHDYAPPVAILVPAHNEAHLIAATIAAAERAAEVYDGTVRMYVVDNASSDETIAVAEAEIEQCAHLTGVVLECPTPGKAIALNYGLSQMTEPFVVRIDADTVIGDLCLANAMRHFANPAIGAVGGLPLPTTDETFFDHARLVEVLVRHGFFQISLLGYDGILGIPGMFVAYRKAALDRAGAIVQGMNGEDTDICLRMSAAGYRSLAEPAAVYHSETPRSWAHMREQRTRWFRSIYHLAGHNRHTIFGQQTMAGAIVLPLQLVNAARRAMLAPMLIYATLVLVVFPSLLPGLRWQPIVASVVGLPALMTVLICMLHRQWRAVLYVPHYLVFRIVRSYFTIAAVLSLVYPPIEPRFPGRHRPGPAGRSRLRRPAGPDAGRARRTTGQCALVKRLLAVGGIVLVAVLCFGAWRHQTSRVLDQVEVHTGRPVCVGTTLDGDHTIRAQRRMACSVTVTVSNSSSRTVRVRQVELPYFGSQGRWVIQAGKSTSSQLVDHGVDASLPIDADLDSGDLLQFGIQLAYRESGCSGGRGGGTDSVSSWPTVTVAFLGRTEELGGDGELRFSQVAASRGCQTG